MFKPSSIALQIVTHLCAGKTSKETQAALNLTPGVFESELATVRVAACLPKEKRTYQARAEDILANVNKLAAFAEQCEKDEIAYRATLVKFNF